MATAYPRECTGKRASRDREFEIFEIAAWELRDEQTNYRGRALAVHCESPNTTNGRHLHPDAAILPPGDQVADLLKGPVVSEMSLEETGLRTECQLDIKVVPS